MEKGAVRLTAEDYILGSADPELRRLRTISGLYRDVTLRWLERGGRRGDDRRGRGLRSRASILCAS